MHRRYGRGHRHTFFEIDLSILCKRLRWIASKQHARLGFCGKLFQSLNCRSLRSLSLYIIVPCVLMTPSRQFMRCLKLSSRVKTIKSREYYSKMKMEYSRKTRRQNAQSRSSLLLAPICKAEIPVSDVTCEVLSGPVLKKPSFSRFSFGCAGCNSSTCERLVSLHASYFTSCSCSALQLPFSLSRFSFFLFQIGDLSRKGISSKSGWLGLIETFGACVAGISTGNCLCRPPLRLLCFTVPSYGETYEIWNDVSCVNMVWYIV